MKRLLTFFVFIFILSVYPTEIKAQQNDMFKQKRERKKVWRKWRKNKQSYNPYVDAKAKNKPSAKMARGNKKEMKRQKKVAKKQLRKGKKAVND